MNTGSEVSSEFGVKKTTVLYITDAGLRLAERLKSWAPDAEIVKYAPAVAEDLWRKNDALVFIMASGIVVRTIAPLLRDKRTDPAVVVLDEAGKHAISLVGGHLGGANELARGLAAFLGGEAVITTASDVNGLPSLDIWAREHDLVIEDWGMLPLIGTRFVNNGALRVYEDQGSGVRGQRAGMHLPDEFLRVAEPRFADVIISNRQNAYEGPSACAVAGDDCAVETCRVKGQLYLRPRNLVIGIGCNSGTSQDELESAVRQTLDEHNLAFRSIRSIATIDIKGNEPGLRAFVEKYAFAFRTFRADELNRVEGLERSDVVFKATGAQGVAEPAALVAAGTDRLLVAKQKKGNVTVAAAIKAVRSPGRHDPHPRPDEDSPSPLLPLPSEGEDKRRGGIIFGEGKRERGLFQRGVRSELNRPQPPFDKGGRGGIFIVGTGPGSLDHITPAALNAINKSDVIVGYGTYLDLIKELLRDKEVVSTGMTQEVDRCRKAVELAQAGKIVSVISGGDPGVYAMAGLVFELLKAEAERMGRWEVEKTEQNTTPLTSQLHNFSTSMPSAEVIPGISALNAAASRLGAPLMHDFACISLSDRLTPWEMIEKRLEAAAAADFVIVLYNPRSKGRAGHLSRAREIVLRHRDTKTAVGIVKGAMREQEMVIVTDLASMLDTDVDMQTTVIIGNSKTFVWNNLLITPRGYEIQEGKKVRG